MKKIKFYNEICNLENLVENRDLKSYLLALLKLVKEYGYQLPSPGLFLTLLQKAFTSTPEPFLSDWLKLKNAPENELHKNKYIKIDLNPHTAQISNSETPDYHYLIAVLLFQIAELHKMEVKQLNNELRYFGVISETGHRWYNFDPISNLECGVRYIIDIDSEEEEEFIVNWGTLGVILEAGRQYE